MSRGLDLNDSILPDFVDDPASVLPSFHAIRKRTHDALYASGVDKSPKGSVDEPIRELVDLINQHPSFATLSSCSGRIAVFDPVHASAAPETETDGNDNETAQATDHQDSGKGSGGWLFVSHEPIDDEMTNDILQCMKSVHQGKCPCSFRFEPMLLHVAAANSDRARQLMTLVLALGFRESGLIVTPSRITVAIRSYSLALTVPLASSGPLRLPETYLRSLIDESNRRLLENAGRIQKLFDEIEAKLFQPRQSVHVRCLPDLNLWGHASVVISGEYDGKRVSDILAFGGYGTGPVLPSSGQQHAAPARSNKVFRLRRTGQDWDHRWEQLHTDDGVPGNETTTNILSIDCLPVPWGDRELSAAAVVRPSVICIFGGRTSPTRPRNDLLMCEYAHAATAIAMKPSDVRGQSPLPRWGHTLTALKGNESHLAVLIGGRTETSTLSSVHLLSIARDAAADASHLLWETLTSPPLPTISRFHHAAVSLGSRVLIFGGLSALNDLLETFSEKPKCPPFLLDVGPQGNESSVLAVEGAVQSCFGHSVTSVEMENGCRLIVICGGVSQNPSQSPIQLYDVHATPGLVNLVSRTAKLYADDDMDFGATVHHQCLALPLSNGTTIDFVTTGGGVQGFGFQPIFAKSYLLTVSLSDHLAEADQSSNRPRLRNNCLRNDPRPTTRNVSAGSAQTASDVLYVHKQDAKAMKILLEACSFLNPNYRMSPAAGSENIAVPVTHACLLALESEQESEWKDLVLGQGKEVLPYRSAAFARHGSTTIRI